MKKIVTLQTYCNYNLCLLDGAACSYPGNIDGGLTGLKCLFTFTKAASLGQWFAQMTVCDFTSLSYTAEINGHWYILFTNFLFRTIQPFLLQIQVYSSMPEPSFLCPQDLWENGRQKQPLQMSHSCLCNQSHSTYLAFGS